MKNTFYSELSIDKKYRYNLDETTIKKILKNDDQSYKAFRKSSTSFCSRIYVRQFVFNKYKNKCCYCGSIKELQLDHIKSVYNCYHTKDFMYCNNINNLQLLCSVCNLKKSKK